MTSRRRLVVSAVLFVAMGVVYRVFLWMWSSVSDAGTIPLGSLFWLFVKLGAMAALLFGVIAYREAGWTSKDAARTAALAWAGLAAFYAMTSTCACVPLATAIPLLPFVMGATLGHEIGHARHAIDGAA